MPSGDDITRNGQSRTTADHPQQPMTHNNRLPSRLRLYPKGTGAGISLVVLIVLGVLGIAQLDEAKRAAFREGFECANNPDMVVTHSSYNCQTYRINVKTNKSNAQRNNGATHPQQP
jgi:hypothetical protein